MRIGYVPYSPDFSMPGDRRRFVSYARSRGLSIEIADPNTSYDVVVLSERADISVWHQYDKGKIVYDLIDSYLAIPHTSIKGLLRGLAKFAVGQSRHLQINYWSAVQQMCARADAVICTTLEQKADIQPFCKNVHIILDVHSAVTRNVKTDYSAGEPFKIAWEGLPHTLPSLELVSNAIRNVSRHRPVELHVVTDLEHFRYLGRYLKASTVPMLRKIHAEAILHEWREESCASIICNCDLAIIPLDLNDPFAAGKPENKMLLFWRMGMPVIASATPAYVRAMSNIGLDLLCRNEKEWEYNLERCIQSEDLRREAGRRGLQYAETAFGEEEIYKRWDNVFESLKIY